MKALCSTFFLAGKVLRGSTGMRREHAISQCEAGPFYSVVAERVDVPKKLMIPARQHVEPATAATADLHDSSRPSIDPARAREREGERKK